MCFMFFAVLLLDMFSYALLKAIFQVMGDTETLAAITAFAFTTFGTLAYITIRIEHMIKERTK